MRRIAALLLVFAPLAVFAETPPPEVSVAHDEPAPATSVAQPAPAAPVGAPIAAPVIPAATPVIAAVAQAPRWSIGAGVGFNSSGMFLSSASVFSLWWPAATASVERAVGDRTWLTVGASGSFDREETKASDSILSTIPRRDTGQLVLTAGVRRPVSRPGAPVEVSALVLAEGGALRFRSGTSSSTDVEQRAWLVGASAGIAVERALAAGLALRISTGILGVRYWRGKLAYAGGPSVTTSDLSAQLRLSPSIELRLAF
ncbi:MAG TPA: hypothetical protein VF912_19730 [Anaeromyxobacter sp.]